MKHVAFITEDFPPLPGGIARLCWEVSDRLAMLGWRVTVIAPELGEAPERVSNTHARIIRVTGRRPLRDLKMALQLRPLGTFDAVICATWYPDGLVALLSRVRAPVAIWAHGSELYDWNRRGGRRLLTGLRRRVRHRVFGRADVVFADSRFTRRLVKEFAPACQRIEVIPLGTDPSVFRPDLKAEEVKRRLGLSGEKVILSVSRLAAHKGHETVMRAVRLLSPRSALKYVIVGDGPRRQSLEVLSERLGIRRLVHFAGKVADEELPLYYSMADVFALCTEERRSEGGVEGFGLVFLEASASGLPVVATNAGGIPDAVVDGETGFLVPPGDSAAVATAVDRLLGDAELAAKMGAHGRQRVLDQFNWDNTSIAVSRQLESLLSSSGSQVEAS